MNVWQIAKRHRALLATGIGLGLLGSAASLSQPLLLGELIDAVSLDKSPVWPIAALGGLFCADALLAAFHAYAIGRAGENIVFDIRRSLVGRLLRADMGAYSRLDHGDVFTRTVTDTSIARVSLSGSLAQIVTSAFMVAGGIGIMAWIDWRMLLVTLGCLGAATAVSLLLARQVRRVSLVNREDTSAFGSGVQRVMGAMATVKASRAEDREAERIGSLADRARRSGIRVQALSAMFTPAMNVGTQLSLAAVIGWGMTRVATGTMDLADLTAFVMYLFYLVAPLVMLFLSIGEFQQGRAAIDRVTELGALEQEEPAAPAPAVLAEGTAVEFDRVVFGYGGGSGIGSDSGSGEPALKGASFTVPERGLTAVVGPSGAGKTTLFQLVERFHRPDSGSIRIGGKDIAEMPLDQLRTLVGYVDQDSALMRGTIRENLTYARPDADEAAVERAVRLASLTEVIAGLPQGLDTPLGERGAGLSGGQRQRLVIARTLLQDPKVVLLDEATAHLDGDTEAELRETITEIARHCAVIAIAHRISTVRDADRIVVLESGRVRATGTHARLLADDELYRRIAERQLVTEGAGR
ncbi:ABC transporter ATP-binding protein/permease [Streptomyces sp. NBC_01351]|uniref:ABC transporter ATP-binding protein n=1 Tax=Streptomyces sp. NBC_01351 TaxID=2903833 RepID=UPI002E3535D4|nr:ABC transporter ATP-binding protein [Streptomyces sp. NBC_01351]